MTKKSRRKRHPVFAVIRRILMLFYPRHTVIGFENVTPGPSVFVCNHVQAYGPLVMSFYFPLKFRPWVMGAVFDPALCADYLEGGFITQELKLRRPFSRWLARIIAPLCMWVMDVQGAIPVYKGERRILETFSLTTDALAQGDAVVIFPEDPGKRFSGALDDLQRGFVQLARLCHKTMGEPVSFYPVFIDKAHRKILVGKPIALMSPGSFRTEKETIRLYLRDSIDALARAGKDS